jgi:UDP-N-acetylglucosamine diphosphorylase / glucose-1-phosphate thymidylyltransferase / UDP-N-acetylgalactosamine diphosphorylase / glucosamine-1-phosphate N-acetyltransferase / galactosamine-1-phosphate N-acetyltransferase
MNEQKVNTSGGIVKKRPLRPRAGFFSCIKRTSSIIEKRIDGFRSGVNGNIFETRHAVGFAGNNSDDRSAWLLIDRTSRLPFNLPFCGAIMLEPDTFFDLADFPHADIFAQTGYVWEALRSLKQYCDDIADQSIDYEQLTRGSLVDETLVLHQGILSPGKDCSIRYGDVVRGGLQVFRGDEQLAGASVIMAGAVLLGRRIRIGSGVLIESGTMIKEPAVIGDQTEVRQGAYLRGYCLVGRRCIVGHATEVKHSIFLNDAKAGHFAYVGDSILGGGVNLGAGTKLANFRFIPGEIQVKTMNGPIPTGLKKFGAIFGDRVQTGCNAVTSPGTVVGLESIIMPNTTVLSGYHPSRSVLR